MDRTIKLDILAIGAHPDDVELGAGGTIFKSIKQGKKVGIIDLTKGELSTRGTPKIRNNEAEKAKEILNISVRENLQFNDGFLTNDKEHQIKVIEVLRKYQPNIVLANAVSDRHPDHSKASKLVSDSCFLSGLPKIETIHNSQKQTAWRPKKVYHYIQWNYIKADFVVDISDCIDTKMESILAYSSQFYNPNSTEPETFIAKKNFLDTIKYRCQYLGKTIGVEYAEGFTVERFIGVKSLDDLI